MNKRKGVTFTVEATLATLACAVFVLLYVILFVRTPPQIAVEKAILCNDGSATIYIKNMWMKPDRLLAVYLNYSGAMHRGYIANNGTDLVPAGAVANIVGEAPPWYFIYNPDGTVNISAAVRGFEPVEIGGWIYVQFNVSMEISAPAIITVEFQESKTQTIATSVQSCELVIDRR